MLIAAEALEQTTATVLHAAGCSQPEAERVSRRLVLANLMGHDSHGVNRLARYVTNLADGDVVADRTAEVVTRSQTFAIVDGHFGFGQTVGEQAVNIGIEIAGAGGAAIVALRHAGHIGRAGDWAEMAAGAGLVSIHIVSARGTPLVAPFGAIDRRFGTDPIAIGVPRPGLEPLVHDFATAIIAEGKANVATEGGPSVPPGSFISAEGELTDDPDALYGPGRPARSSQGKGALRAMGDHKGSGLAFMCELLGGALTGSGTTKPERQRFANGMLSIYVDPGAFGTSHAFADDVEYFVDWVKQSRVAVGHDDVLVPGELERRHRDRQLRDGIDLAVGTWASMLAAGESVGLSSEDLEAMRAP